MSEFVTGMSVACKTCGRPSYSTHACVQGAATTAPKVLNHLEEPYLYEFDADIDGKGDRPIEFVLATTYRDLAAAYRALVEENQRLKVAEGEAMLVAESAEFKLGQVIAERDQIMGQVEPIKEDLARMTTQRDEALVKQDELGAIIIASHIPTQQTIREVIHPHIARLTAERDRLKIELETLEDTYAWRISPAMAQAKIDELNAKVQTLQSDLHAAREREGRYRKALASVLNTEYEDRKRIIDEALSDHRDDATTNSAPNSPPSTPCL